MKRLASAAIVIALAAALPAASLAQPVINPKALPPWVSEKEAAALAASAKKEIAAYANSRHAERKASLEAADVVVAAFRKKLEELAKSHQDYKSAVATMEKLGGSPAEDRVQAVKEAWERSLGLFEHQVRELAGDPTKLGDSILGVLRKQDATYQRAQDQILGFVALRTPTQAKKTTPGVLFKPPFGVQDTGTVKERPTILVSGAQPIADATAEVSKIDSAMTLHAYAGGGGHAAASATIGCFVEVPAGRASMTVKMMYDYSYSVAAWSSTGSDSRAGAHGLVSIFRVDGAGVSQARQGDLFPPVSTTSALGFTIAEPDGSLYLEFSPLSVSAGKRYFVVFTAEADALTAGAAYASADMKVTPTAMEITFR